MLSVYGQQMNADRQYARVREDPLAELNLTPTIGHMARLWPENP